MPRRSLAGPAPDAASPAPGAGVSCARTAGRDGAWPSMTTPTRTAGSRSVPTATTTPAIWSGSGGHPNCGDGSPSPSAASSPHHLGLSETAARERGAGAVRQSGRVPTPRHHPLPRPHPPRRTTHRHRGLPAASGRPGQHRAGRSGQSVRGRHLVRRPTHRPRRHCGGGSGSVRSWTPAPSPALPIGTPTAASCTPRPSPPTSPSTPPKPPATYPPTSTAAAGI